MRRFTNRREEWEDTTVYQEIEEEEDRMNQEADNADGGNTMPIITQTDDLQRLTAVKEATGIFMDGDARYYFLDPPRGWQGPYPSCTEAVIGKMKHAAAQVPAESVHDMLDRVFYKHFGETVYAKKPTGYVEG